MKKLFIFIFFCFFLLIIYGCEKNSEISGRINRPVYPEKTSYDQYYGSKEMSLELNSDFYDALIEFSYLTTSKILTGTQNAMYSPISLYMALSMLAEGCDENSLEELLEALNVGTLQNLRHGNENLFRKLCFENEKGKLLLANSVWLNKDRDFVSKTLDILSKDYYAHSFSLDFSNPDKGKEIGKWVSKYTNGRLGNENNEFDLKPDKLVLLINTIYFYDEWVSQFIETKNIVDQFYISNTSFATTYMNQTVAAFYLETDEFIACSLDFKNNGKMVFVLPTNDVSDVLENTELLKKAITHYRSQNKRYASIQLSLPKFEFKTDLDLIRVLKQLGIDEVFDPERANISKLLKDDGYVSEIIQKSFIKVDEKGCEATAYTKVEIVDTSGPDENIDIKFNKPFIFAIIAPDDIPLFIGVMNNPF